MKAINAQKRLEEIELGAKLANGLPSKRARQADEVCNGGALADLNRATPHNMLPSSVTLATPFESSFTAAMQFNSSDINIDESNLSADNTFAQVSQFQAGVYR